MCVPARRGICIDKHKIWGALVETYQGTCNLRRAFSSRYLTHESLMIYLTKIKHVNLERLVTI